MQPQPQPQPQLQPNPTTSQPAPSAQSTSAAADASAKAFLAQTITQIEAAFAATATKPHLRASEVQRIRAEYLKTKYNVEIKTSLGR